MTRWPTSRAKHLYLAVDERAGESRPSLLAVSIHHGVVPRSSLTDDLPRAEDLSNYKVCRPGDIVLNRMRAFQGAIGHCHEIGLVSPDYLVLRPNAEPRYLHHLFRSGWFVGEMKARLRGIGNAENGGVRTPRINREDLDEIRVAVPSSSEQEAIADYLDTETARIDALVVKKRQMVELAGRRRVNVMTDGLRGALAGGSEGVPSQLPWIDVRPSAWSTAKVTYLARLGSGHTPSRQHPEWWEDCTIPWITTGEVAQVRDDRTNVVTETREKISELGVANSSATVHPAGTVFLCRTASAGYSGIMGTAMATSQDFATWTCGPRLLPRYLLLCLRVMRQDLLGRLTMGSTHKTIYMPDIEALKIPLPSVAEQEHVVGQVIARLKRLDEATDRLHRQIDLLVEHRQALITAAVTGELEIPGVAA